MENNSFYLLINFAASFIPAFIAYKRGRRFLTWYILSLVLSPLLSTIVVLILPRNANSASRENYVEPGPDSRETPAEEYPADDPYHAPVPDEPSPFSGAAEDGACPHCGAPVKKGDRVCPYCDGRL